MLTIKGIHGLNQVQVWANNNKKIVFSACEKLHFNGYCVLRRYDATEIENSLQEILSDLYRLFNLNGRAIIIQTTENSNYRVYAEKRNDVIQLTVIVK